MDNLNLIPQDCPFCAAASKPKYVYVVWHVGCTAGYVCGASGPGRPSVEDAIAAWNTIRVEK